MSQPIIQVSDLVKNFKLPHEKHMTLKASLMNLHKRSYEKQEVLKGLNFEVKEGEFFGVVGRNGGGKSTLLKILAGIYQPTSGTVQVNGKLTPFIELGVGFNSELTGRDNVFMSGVMLGMTYKQVEEVYDDIVEFAELGRFMDQKLKNYSSGMLVRLAFSVAIRANTDILLIDEVLAVGDASFQRKCYNYFEKLKKSKKTVVFISHDMDAIVRFCDRAAIIKDGEFTNIGVPKKIAEEYYQENIARAKHKKLSTKKLDDDGSFRIVDKRINNSKDSAILSSKDKIKISLELKLGKNVEKGTVFGLVVNQGVTNPIFWTNTEWKTVKAPAYKKGDKLTFSAEIDNVFSDGQYSIDFAIRDEFNTTMHLKQQALLKFEVARSSKNGHLLHPEHTLSVK